MADDIQRRAAALRAMAESKSKQPPSAARSENSEDDSVPTDTPVGQGEYVVRKGDCISSIANEMGYFWKTIWEDSANSELRSVRKDPNVLFPGDRVTIPEKTQKDEPGATELRHKFVRIGEPAILRLQVLLEGQPVEHAPYELKIDGRVVKQDSTTKEGRVESAIPANAISGVLTVETDDHILNYNLKLGHIPPVDTIIGVQKRLINLSFHCEESGKLDARTTTALRRFQSQNGLEPSGKPDSDTQAMLMEIHGS